MFLWNNPSSGDINSSNLYCCHLWHENKLLTGELSVYPGFVVIYDTRTNYSLVSYQYTQAVLSSVTQEQTTFWWAVSIPRLCCHLWHENKLLTDELSGYQGFVVICDTKTNYSLMSCQYTQNILLTGELSVYPEQTTHWWAVNIPRLCHLWHKNKLLTVSCQNTQALLSSVTQEQSTH